MKAIPLLLIPFALLGRSDSSPSQWHGFAKSLRLDIYKSFDGKRPAKSFDVTDSESVVGILEVLRRGIEQRDHDCSSIGMMEIAFANGKTVTIQILPGHKAENYEFRYDKHNYRVPRDAFLAALQKAGVDISAIPKGRK